MSTVIPVKFRIQSILSYTLPARKLPSLSPQSQPSGTLACETIPTSFGPLRQKSWSWLQFWSVELKTTGPKISKHIEAELGNQSKQANWIYLHSLSINRYANGKCTSTVAQANSSIGKPSTKIYVPLICHAFHSYFGIFQIFGWFLLSINKSPTGDKYCTVMKTRIHNPWIQLN